MLGKANSPPWNLENRRRIGFRGCVKRFRDLISKVQSFWDLARAEFGEDMQKSLAQVRLQFDFILQTPPARRQRVGKNSPQALLVPIAVLERSNDRR